MGDPAKCSRWTEEQLSGSGDLKRSGKQPAGEKHPAGNPGRTGRCFHFWLLVLCQEKVQIKYNQFSLFM